MLLVTSSQQMEHVTDQLTTEQKYDQSDNTTRKSQTNLYSWPFLCFLTCAVGDRITNRQLRHISVYTSAYLVSTSCPLMLPIEVHTG